VAERKARSVAEGRAEKAESEAVMGAGMVRGLMAELAKSRLNALAALGGASRAGTARPEIGEIGGGIEGEGAAVVDVDAPIEKRLSDVLRLVETARAQSASLQAMSSEMNNGRLQRKQAWASFCADVEAGANPP